MPHGIHRIRTCNLLLRRIAASVFNLYSFQIILKSSRIIRILTAHRVNWLSVYPLYKVNFKPLKHNYLHHLSQLVPWTEMNSYTKYFLYRNIWYVLLEWVLNYILDFVSVPRIILPCAPKSLVRVQRFELWASWSQITRATNCATPGYKQDSFYLKKNIISS